MNNTNGTENAEAGGFNETADAAGEVLKKHSADGYIAAGILALTVLAVVIGGVYMCMNNKKLLGMKESNWSGSSGFEPPIERANYLAAKEKLDPSKPAELEELRKLLMRRAIKAIPIVLSLQNEGNSIERLYKRGMLTDDMHFKVKDLKAFVDQEFQDVQYEADDLLEGWSQHIWPQAMQFHQMIQKQAGVKTDDEEEEEEAKQTEVGANGADKKKKGKESSSEGEKVPAVKKQAPVVVTKTPQQIKEAAEAAIAAAAAAEGVDPEVIRAREAEKMAQQLLLEEEKEQKKKNKAKNNAKK